MTVVYGYARVSTEGQSLTAQVAELTAAGCQRVFQEKISGARSDRRQLARLLAELDDGDTVIVTRLDRPARSTWDLAEHAGRHRHGRSARCRRSSSAT
jgi:DNA invertase Pin-like site-specific DNA recombinase